MSEFNSSAPKVDLSIDFSSPVPPSNYIPGVSRGAVGFTTTADYVTVTDIIPENDNESTLLGSFRDQNDEDADSVWESVSNRMDKRRKRRREEKEKEILHKFRRKKPKIQSQYSDVKDQLRSMSLQDWHNISETVDRTQKKQKFLKFTPVPDTVLLQGVSSNLSTKQTHQNTLSFAKETIVKSRLSKVEDSVKGQTTVDPKNYITGLDSMVIMKDTDITDLKKAREMLGSLTTSNPNSALGWISRARVEELAGKLSKARKLILEGCSLVPKSENVWLEAARLHGKEMAQRILSSAVEAIPESEELWIYAVSLESNKKSKKKVLRKALEIIPKSVRLWKEIIELENENGARIMLAKAVEYLPENIELWLALARLETYENARKVLNTARKKNPSEALIWITASQLEESQGNFKMVDVIIKKTITSLKAQNVSLKRDEWLKYAYMCEEGKHLLTCNAIIKNTIHFELEKDEFIDKWIKDANSAMETKPLPHFHTAKSIYLHGTTVFSGSDIFWIKLIELERRVGRGGGEEILKIMSESIKKCGKESETLWLLYSKELFQRGDVKGAKEILIKAFNFHTKKEDLYLFLVQIEISLKSYGEARKILEKATSIVNTPRIWMKYASFERRLSSNDSKLQIKVLNEALKRFKSFDKLWMMRGQVEEHNGKFNEAINIYKEGLKHNENSIPLWCCCIKLEAKMKNYASARGTLAKAKIFNKNNEKLWHLSVLIERMEGNINSARQLIANGLLQCPQSGLLWSESIDLCERPKQITRIKLALDTMESASPFLLMSIGKKFWRDGKIETSRKYFNRAIKVDKMLGDSWIYCYKFELLNGSFEKQNNVVKLCKETKPYKGDIWCTISKEGKEMSVEKVLKRGGDYVDVFNPKVFLSSYVYKKEKKKGLNEDNFV